MCVVQSVDSDLTDNGIIVIIVQCAVPSFLLCVQEMAKVTPADLLHSAQDAPPISATPMSSVPSAGMHGHIRTVIGKPFISTESQDHVHVG